MDFAEILKKMKFFLQNLQINRCFPQNDIFFVKGGPEIIES
jgi:hypothetical protein